MIHPLVTQLRFTRSEWLRGLKAVTAEEAARRFGPINPIAWMIGHLAWQEQLYWLERAQGETVVPEVKQVRHGKPLAGPSRDGRAGGVARGPEGRPSLPPHAEGRAGHAPVEARVPGREAGDE